MGGGWKGALLAGVAAGLAAVGGVVAYVALGGGVSGVGRSATPERALIVLEGMSSDGARIAQVLIDADVSSSPARVVIVDPMSRVEVPGTTYDTLRDSYPFGGGPAVAAAYASLSGGADLPTLVIRESEWSGLLDAGGGLPVSLETSVDVFTGGDLHVFDASTTRVAGGEVSPLLMGLDYGRAFSEAGEVREGLGRSFLAAVARRPDDLTVLLARGVLGGDLSGARAQAFLNEVVPALGSARVTWRPGVR